MITHAASSLEHFESNGPGQTEAVKLVVFDMEHGPQYLLWKLVGPEGYNPLQDNIP